MPYTVERRGTILTVMVAGPVVDDVHRGLTDIQKHLDDGGISVVQIGYDDAAWRTGWAVSTLTAFERTMADLNIRVEVLGVDPRHATVGTEP
jgi:hypothetical protein